ncbi:ribonuclease E inhibitor RraB [Aureibaculum marinum]|uniref:Ribonuclease E inhibitor RraB n=1 Tax=Aureibaculum marinum TaxID=2487930 RepID=A0A3N4NM00_9FLAO|nr:ribonuclease E inhibitor RraB [Aureibaculum marinum]RPD96565.1 ribonuclease E inhibitor RraB [Aureibaculum marinum]
MIKTFLLPIVFSLSFFVTNAQDDWGSYVIEKEKGIMAITLNYRYALTKPNYKNLVLVGKRTNKCYKNGAPNAQGLEEIYNFSDAVANELNKLSKKNRLVGIVTYLCSGFDAYYIKDTTNVRQKIDSLYQKKFSNSKNYLVIKRDKRWDYFKEVLYPKDDSENFFMSQDLLNQMYFEGADLSIKRKIKHYFYFKKDKNRQSFLDKIKTVDFKVDSLNFKKENNFPYELQIHRENELYPTFMAELTKVLSTFALINKGYYDGWGIEPESIE